VTGPLDSSPDGLREDLRLVGEKLAQALAGLPEAPVARTASARRAARRAGGPLPERGAPLRGLVAELIDQLAPPGINTSSGGYLGFIPGGGLPDAALADLIGGVLNRFTGIALAAPGLVAAEVQVLRWLCAELGLPADGSGGLLTSGGSLATLTALAAARERHLGEDTASGALFVAEQTHHSARKAARLLGLPARAVIAVAQDAAHRMRPAALRAAIADARARGQRPFCLISTAGSTATGTVDPLRDLADVCQDEGLWHHVDGAWGACFALTARGRAALDGLSRADSITLDPHKGLFLPYGTGALLVRDRAALRAAFAEPSSYLPTPADAEDLWDFADLGPELSRPARGLRLWLPLRRRGVGAFRAALDEKLDLAALAWERLSAVPGLQLGPRPALSLFTFTAGDEARTRRVLSRVNARGRVFLTGATVPGPAGPTFVGRVCVLHLRTTAAHIDALEADLRAALAEEAPDVRPAEP
jgi:aromatic-L-amino-acid decarboxylase